MAQSDIREDMEVVGSDGKHVGIIDHMDGPDRIKLTKTDPAAGGKHHFIPIDWVDYVDSDVHLNMTGKDATTQWQTAA